MNNESPLVSIVIPVYKVEKYIGECIRSVISQSYENLEIILVNDGSPDNSGAICDTYAKQDSRIKVIHNENQGVSAARACGVQNAHGQWLSFLDSDDTLPEDAMEILISVVQRHDCGIVVGYPNNEIPISSQTLLTSNEYIKYSIIGEKKIRAGLWGKLFDIRLFSQEKMYVPRDIIQGQDMLVNIKLALANNKDVILIPKSIYNYRTNLSSTMHTFIPTIEYEERYDNLLESYIPEDWQKVLRIELIIAKVNTWHFLAISTGNVSWMNSNYAKDVLRGAESIRLPIRKRLFLKRPLLYILLYKFYRLCFVFIRNNLK